MRSPLLDTSLVDRRAGVVMTSLLGLVNKRFRDLSAAVPVAGVL